jgi:hypothetical protein
LLLRFNPPGGDHYQFLCILEGNIFQNISRKNPLKLNDSRNDSKFD